ncbi:hypothetical protein CYMTET_14904 [Cymbomonas tetramitiformis]|uniref:Uncharacterized protein n=1 Tax=Cymbomonas tetramitiformis TaxID=36881 RepID=A0AAE0GFN5_9CHLO|nr:hypothetical protein CYMTET_14904 [Cymbomonas tetramitiformis]
MPEEDSRDFADDGDPFEPVPANVRRVPARWGELRPEEGASAGTSCILLKESYSGTTLGKPPTPTEVGGTSPAGSQSWGNQSSHPSRVQDAPQPEYAPHRAPVEQK